MKIKKEPLLLDEEEINETELKALADLVRLSSSHTRQELNESLQSVRKKLARMLVLSESVDPGGLDHDLRMVFLGKLNAINQRNVTNSP